MGQAELKKKLKLQIHQAIEGRVDIRFHLEGLTEIYVKLVGDYLVREAISAEFEKGRSF
jgi:type II secretory pathway predicted ATPase ExeA